MNRFKPHSAASVALWIAASVSLAACDSTDLGDGVSTSRQAETGQVCTIVQSYDLIESGSDCESSLTYAFACPSGTSAVNSDCVELKDPSCPPSSVEVSYDCYECFEEPSVCDLVTSYDYDVEVADCDSPLIYTFSCPSGTVAANYECVEHEAQCPVTSLEITYDCESCTGVTPE